MRAHPCATLGVLRQQVMPAHPIDLGDHGGESWWLRASECAGCGRVFSRIESHPLPAWCRPAWAHSEEAHELTARLVQRECYGARGDGYEPGVDRVFTGEG